MKRLSLAFLLSLIPALLIFGWSPATVLAESRVSGVISQDTSWSADQGPYLLEDNVTVPDGVVLTIGPGVHITTAPEADQGDPGYDPVIYVTGGHLEIVGSDSGHVSIANTGGISVSGGSTGAGSADIFYTDLSAGSYLYFENARGLIASSTVSGAYIGMYSKDSDISVGASRFQNDEVGIEVAPHSIFQLGAAASRFGTGGIGNATADLPVETASSSLDIAGSIFAGNTDMALKNGAEYTVQAMNNWWGSAGGPEMSGPNSIRGLVEYTPWLSAEPIFATSSVAWSCCSDVLFIPGLEGSRLYRDQTRPLGLGTGVNRLWEPNRNADVKKLDLDPTGSSTDPSIYSGAPIDKALGFVDIYGQFMGLLDGLVKSGTVNGWRSFGYDWRQPIDRVVLGGEKKATTTESLIQVVSDLAKDSKTGKVTIVAHSNGGLVAKYLVSALAGIGKAGLIDTVISVAVPYLGTPVAIPALLHGDGQDILGGLIANRSNMRDLGSNMASAYSLLPSRGFFERVFSPTIAFASTTIPDLNNGAYPQSINSSAAQTAFIADTANVRKQPASSDTRAPIKGNQWLLSAADIIHGLLDPFVWPANIARWAIVGWNSTTTEGVLYSDKGHVALQDLSGDGTVKSQSAGYNDGQVLATDLEKQSAIDGYEVSHMNILEASTTKAAISSILTNPAASNAKVLDEISRLPGITVGDMDWNAMDAAYSASRKELVVSTHSPVKLHVYDSHGNHTGEIPLPPEIASQVEPGLYTMKEEKVPGSTYDVPGCADEDTGDCETVITLPDDGERYTAVVDGVGTGTFTLDIERVRATSTVETIRWSDVPVTASARASTMFTGDPDFVISNDRRLASSTGPLSIDVNGNGTTDVVLNPGASLDRDRNPFWTNLRDWLMRLKTRGLNGRDRSKILDEARTILQRFR